MIYHYYMMMITYTKEIKSRITHVSFRHGSAAIADAQAVTDISTLPTADKLTDRHAYQLINNVD